MRYLCFLLAASSLLADDPELLKVRRIYVDRLTGGETAAQLRDMIISSLQSAKRFVITENPDRADVMLKGSAEDLVYTETFQSSESIDARASVGSSRSSRSGVATAPVGVTVGQNEATRIAERKHEAMASVRLVNKEGDVIWSTTKESTGAKFRGASADVADKVTKQLIADITKAKAESQ